MKKPTSSLVIRRCKSETTIRYHPTPTRGAKMQALKTMPSSGQSMGPRRSSPGCPRGWELRPETGELQVTEPSRLGALRLLRRLALVVQGTHTHADSLQRCSRRPPNEAPGCRPALGQMLTCGPCPPRALGSPGVNCSTAAPNVGRNHQGRDEQGRWTQKDTSCGTLFVEQAGRPSDPSYRMYDSEMRLSRQELG